MAQWVNRLRNNIFVNPPPSPLLCKISGALHLAQPSLTAGRQAGRLAGWLAGWLAKKTKVVRGLEIEIHLAGEFQFLKFTSQVNFKNLEFATD